MSQVATNSSPSTLTTLFIFACGTIAGILLFNSRLGRAVGVRNASPLISGTTTLSGSGVYISQPKLEFKVGEDESRVWFGLMVANPGDEDEKIVGFQSSCACNSIDQRLPMTLPRGETRFITGSIDTATLSSPFTIHSQLYLESGPSEATKFQIAVAPR